MESFRTIIHPSKNDWSIDHQDAILMLGSCFTDNIGERLKADVFNVDYNLFGTVFNPISILRLVERAVNGTLFLKEEFFEKEGIWQHFELNHTMGNTQLSVAVKHANVSLTKLRSKILKAEYVILTYGTAWVFEEKKTRDVVSNCHKLPGSLFDKKMIGASDLLQIIKKTKEIIENVNTNAKFIFTVSPVRHWKDGAVNNSMSKSSLRVAINESLCSKSDYFPAFELMIDDLRDYRFYKKDMLHPNEQAVDYIYDLFCRSFFTDSTSELNKSVRGLKQALSHRPINEESDTHQQFVKKTRVALKTLFVKHPFIESRW